MSEQDYYRGCEYEREAATERRCSSCDKWTKTGSNGRNITTYDRGEAEGECGDNDVALVLSSCNQHPDDKFCTTGDFGCIYWRARP